jgi:hypothetical protein
MWEYILPWVHKRSPILVLKGNPWKVQTYQWLEEVHEAGSYHTCVAGIEALHPATEPVIDNNL